MSPPFTRTGAWLIHSFFDGIILGSSDPKPSVMLPLTFAILVCAMQVCHPIALLSHALRTRTSSRAPPLAAPPALKSHPL